MSAPTDLFGTPTLSDTIDHVGLRLLQERDQLEAHARRALLGLMDQEPSTARINVTVVRAGRTSAVVLTWWLYTRRIEVCQTVPNRVLDQSRDMRAMALTASVSTLCRLAQVSRTGAETVTAGAGVSQ